ncbi:3921_t:CDS:1 [Racocetra fulgida]|uniref:3921_t:CDS:1 n=1 Tax=Racocetra fulgida TaxID=60492 RepID=A0A9N9FRJ6_9GLOM|nr:3921_t:CDS:1 [Racocetra fulgida]
MYSNVKNFLLIISSIYLANFIQLALSQCGCALPISPASNVVKVTAPDGIIIRSLPCINGSRSGSLSNGETFSPNSDCAGESINGFYVWLSVSNPDGFVWAGETDYPT